MRNLVIFNLIMLITASTFASSRGDLLGASKNSSWGKVFSETKYETEEQDPDPVSDNTSASNRVCTSKEQTSIPYKSFLALLADGNINILRDEQREELELKSNKMIGNCNSMLEYNFYQPASGRPYMFQVGIKRPSGCSAEKCKYIAQLGEDGAATGEVKEIEVEPTYDGFVQCLRESGVLEGDKFNTSKIAASEFSFKASNVKDTDKFWFYSNGPEGPLQGGVYSGNLKDEKNCKFYEDISKGGYVIYSKEDVRMSKMESLYQEVCAKSNYKDIEKYLPDFKEFEFMYQSLIQIRNDRIKKNIKDLHEELKRKDYSELDANKYNRIITDFYEKVITPKRKKIERLVSDKSKTSDSAVKARLQKEIDELTNELVSLAKSPYLTKNDYANMRSFVKKSPLHEAAWREAALKLYKSNNIAHHYSRFNPKLKSQRKMELASIKEVRQFVKKDYSVQKEKMDKLGKLASDHSLSYVNKYKSKIEVARQNQQIFNQDSQYFIQDEMNYLRSHCYNQQKYWIVNNPLTQRRCVQSVQENIYAIQEDSHYYGLMTAEKIKNYNSGIREWNTIEQQRNAAYGIKNPPPRRAGGPIDPRALRQPRFSQQMNRMMGPPGPMNFNDMYMQQSRGMQFEFRPGVGGSRQPAAGSWNYGLGQNPAAMQGFQNSGQYNFLN